MRLIFLARVFFANDFPLLLVLPWILVQASLGLDDHKNVRQVRKGQALHVVSHLVKGRSDPRLLQVLLCILHQLLQPRQRLVLVDDFSLVLLVLAILGVHFFIYFFTEVEILVVEKLTSENFRLFDRIISRFVVLHLAVDAVLKQRITSID